MTTKGSPQSSESECRKRILDRLANSQQVSEKWSKEDGYADTHDNNDEIERARNWRLIHHTLRTGLHDGCLWPSHKCIYINVLHRLRVRTTLLWRIISLYVAKIFHKSPNRQPGGPNHFLAFPSESIGCGCSNLLSGIDLAVFAALGAGVFQPLATWWNTFGTLNPLVLSLRDQC